MKSWVAAVALLTGLASVADAGRQRLVERAFDVERAGAAPDGFSFASMRQASTGQWTVRREGPRGWLQHAPGPADAAGYALAVAPGEPLRDVVVSVRLRLEGGSRTGGLIWRYQDAGHFYAALLDLERREIAMYRVTGGNRVKLEDEDNLELDGAAWHTIRVVHQGGAAYVTLGGVRVFEERDDRVGRGATGRVGVIAAGDATVAFDDLRAELPRPRR